MRPNWQERLRGQVLPETLVIIASVAVAGVVAFTGLGRHASSTLAEDARGVSPMAGAPVVSRQAAGWEHLVDKASGLLRVVSPEELAQSVRVPAAAGLGVAGPRPPVFTGVGDAFDIVGRLPVRGSQEWRAYAATVRAGLAPGVGQGYAVLPTAERIPAFLGEAMLRRYPTTDTFRLGYSGSKMDPEHERVFLAYRRWVEELLSDALPESLAVHSDGNIFPDVRVQWPTDVSRKIKPTNTDGFHVDGGPVRVALTLVGDATEFMPVTPGIRTGDWSGSPTAVMTEDLARLFAHGFVPVRARRGDIVVFRGISHDPGFADVSWEPTVHRGPASDEPRALVIQSFRAKVQAR